MLVVMYKTTRHHIPEHNLNINDHKNSSSHTDLLVYKFQSSTLNSACINPISKPGGLQCIGITKILNLERKAHQDSLQWNNL